MTNEERGRRTGQHDGPRQQAELPGCCDEPEIEAPRTCIALGFGFTDAFDAPTLGTIRSYVACCFVHPERIEIERFEVWP